MTISMYRKICVTNRHLAQGDFLRQIERVTAAKPTALILREKDLTQEAYEELAVQVLAICRGGRCSLLFPFTAAAGCEIKRAGHPSALEDGGLYELRG